ncbi:hypothetical protein BDL97_11G101000 [Sphagnum fallax]|nr:hypothetical protein BDL97_11G101000 [Sphagnum fallax]
MISGLLGTSEKKISPSFLPVYPIHKVKGSFAETKEGRKEDPPPNFWSPQNSKDFQVPSSPIGSLSSQRTHYQQQQQQQLWLLFQSATICNKLLPAYSEKAEYIRQHDLSSHGQLWSCQQKTTTNMHFELQ